MFFKDRAWKFTIPKPDYIQKLSFNAGNLAGAAVSPMPGVVDRILVSKSGVVKKGDPLVVIVAMKMEVNANLIIINTQKLILNYALINQSLNN